MDCPNCGTELVVFTVPEEYHDHVPGSESAAGLCPRCLTLNPSSDPPAKDPDFGRLGDTFPAASDAEVPMALVLGLLSNLALYRSEIASLLEEVERAGTDPLLVLDRLARDPGVETEVDLRGRRRHLEQLL